MIETANTDREGFLRSVYHGAAQATGQPFGTVARTLARRGPEGLADLIRTRQAAEETRARLRADSIAGTTWRTAGSGQAYVRSMEMRRPCP